MRHTTFTRRPDLRRPVLVVALEGWNDAGEAATTALGFIAEKLGAEVIGHIDPEEFYDFQCNRPWVRLDVAGRRRIEWPAIEVLAATVPEGERDVILLRGNEPNLRWRAFAEEVMAIARELGAELLVSLGALLAEVPHTRPVHVVGTTADTELAAQLDLPPSRYEGPTGMLGVLSDMAARTGLPAISIWAALPHYVDASPNPRAALALVGKLGNLLGLDLDTSSLEEASASFDATVTKTVDDDPDLIGYVRWLEEEADREELANLPAEQLVAEVERFLRDQPGGSRS